MKKILLSAAMLALCTPLYAADAPKGNSLSVNGKVISGPMFRYLLQERLKPGQKPSEEEKDQLVNEAINIVLLSEDALKQKLDKKEFHAASLEMQRMSYLANAALQEKLSSQKFGDKDLKALYKSKFSTPSKEYKARHILLKDEKKANEIIAELKKGAKFEELAKKHSTGPSGPKGGDLGWFTLNRMVKPFSDAVGKMKKGSSTDKPVQTQFGWHVIQLEDTREIPPKKYEEIKGALAAQLQHQALQAYIKGLRAKADIKASK